MTARSFDVEFVESANGQFSTTFVYSYLTTNHKLLYSKLNKPIAQRNESLSIRVK